MAKNKQGRGFAPEKHRKEKRPPITPAAVFAVILGLAMSGFGVYRAFYHGQWAALYVAILGLCFVAAVFYSYRG
ncbi:MAG: hypothetical protein ACLFOY_18220 [Desulfatibacillaceae bacterium]